MAQCTNIFQLLCNATVELNRVFSVPALVITTLKFFQLIGYSFAYILNFMTKSQELERLAKIVPCSFIFELIVLLNMLLTADMPIKQVGGGPGVNVFHFTNILKMSIKNF